MTFIPLFSLLSLNKTELSNNTTTTTHTTTMRNTTTLHHPMLSSASYCVKVTRTDLDYWQAEKSLSGFQFLETLGRGSSAKVKRAIESNSNRQVAIKILAKTTATAEEDLMKFALRESQILVKLNHPNIVKLYKVIETNEKMNLVMEHIEGPSLMSYIEQHKRLSETESRRLFLQMASALNYCHSLSICHRDIKCKNIMIDTKAGNILKLIDFGLSNWTSETKFCNTFCGTPAFAAPEMILGKQYRGPEVDVWSAGIVLYTMLTARFPFNSVFELLQGKYNAPEGVSRECVDLICRMLQLHPEKRPSMQEVLDHNWCKGSCSSSPSFSPKPTTTTNAANGPSSNIRTATPLFRSTSSPTPIPSSFSAALTAPHPPTFTPLSGTAATLAAGNMHLNAAAPLPSPSAAATAEQKQTAALPPTPSMLTKAASAPLLTGCPLRAPSRK
jgi:serine/threonine protein kinase